MREFFGTLMDGYWPLDNEVATDYSGNGNHGTVIGTGIVPTAGIIPGEGYSCPGGAATDRISMGTGLAKERTDAFAMLVWIKHTVIGGVILGRWSGNRGYFILNNGVTGVQRFNLWSTAANRIIVEGTSRTDDGEPHFVCMIYDGSSSANGVQILLDGKRENLSIITNSLTATTVTNTNFCIGNLAGGASPFNGVVDEVAIIPRDIDPRGVTEYYRWAMDSPSKNFLAFTGSGGAYYQNLLRRRVSR